MLQVDGSPHNWLEGRGPRLCLIGAIDDATGKVVGAFFQQAESSWAYFQLFASIFGQHGLPQSIYADHHSVFCTDREPTMDEQLVNQRPTTEVGRDLEELGVTLILAGSPQAKVSSPRALWTGKQPWRIPIPRDSLCRKISIRRIETENRPIFLNDRRHLMKSLR